MKKIYIVVILMALIFTFVSCKNDNIKIGTLIEFGGYDWRVLDIQDDKALILSEMILENREYHVFTDINISDSKITWEQCSLREYLNNSFYNSTFSESEREMIIETELINNKNDELSFIGGNDTIDKIFLLSVYEAKQYFSDDSARVALNSAGEINWWWLRSPNGVGGRVNGRAANVSEKGYAYAVGTPADNSTGGVRPAMWINIENINND